MENPTGNDLNSRLRETIAGLQARGFDDEEAFVIASHRVFPPHQITPGFAKIDPARVWRERIFWVAIAMLLMLAWSRVASKIVFLIPSHLPVWGTWWFTDVVFLLPIVSAMVLLSRGRITRGAKWAGAIMATRARFVFAAVLADAFLLSLRFADILPANFLRTFLHNPLWLLTAPLDIPMFLIASSPDFVLIALATWLLPARLRMDSKPAAAANAGNNISDNPAARFDLDAAIETWRAELLAQHDLTDEERRELESHLRDAVAALQARGLDDAEAFALAWRRAGKPREIATEFAKIDPARVWRERMFWIAAALLLALTWGRAATLLYRRLAPFGFKFAPGDYMGYVVVEFIRFTLLIGPVVALLVFLSSGRVTRLPKWMDVILASRVRLIVAVTLINSFMFLCNWTRIGDLLPNIIHDFHNGFGPRSYTRGILLLFMVGMTPELVLIALVAWLMPARTRRAAKRP